MVEGPGTLRNGQKCRSLLHHKVVDLDSKSRIQDSQCWLGKYLKEIIVVGKELFLVFGIENDASETDTDVALRLHFGMNGSTHITSSTGSNTNFYTTTHGAKKSWRDHNLTIIFERQEIDVTNGATLPSTTILLKAYETTVTGPIPSTIPRRKLLNLASLDVCSDAFEPNDVLEKMKRDTHQNRPISDVLLDQQVFPGVGNVIKVEALHDSRVHPKNIVSNLTEEELLDAILSCRKYAMSWYRTGRAPPKSVYNQVTCGSCGNSTISIQKVGNGSLPRTTFWCNVCQPLHRKVGGDVSRMAAYWNLNHGDVQSDSRTSRKAPLNTPLELASHEANRCKDKDGMQKQQGALVPTDRPRRMIQCPMHGKCLTLKRVKNPSSANISRLFYTCKHSKCTYFAWADLKFPQCKCKPQQKCALRISKTQHSGGKWFFSCRTTSESVIKRKGYVNKQQSGCGFFQWAKHEELESLGPSLTPLL